MNFKRNLLPVFASISAMSVFLAHISPATAGGYSFPNSAATAERSAGCASINDNPSSNSAGPWTLSSKNFIAGEVITVSPGSSATRVRIDYQDDGANEVDVSGSPPATQTYTIPTTGAVDFAIIITGSGGTQTDFSCAGVAAAVTESATTPSAPPAALQASVSQSQSTVVSTNIGTRLTSIGSPVGVSRATPTGAGRTTPGSGRTTPDAGRNIPQGSPQTGGSSGGPAGGGVGNPDEVSSNFSATSAHMTEWSFHQNRSNGRSGSWRELAMMASFDTSTVVLSAAGDDNAPVLSPEQRENILASRPYTFWGQGSYTNVENKRNQSGDDARYSGDVWGYNLGLDYRFQPNLYAGISFGVSETNLSTTYNAGSYDETSWTFTPYAVFKPTENIKLSAMAGYAIGDIDQTRASASITSTTDSKMWFGAFNASYQYQPKPDMPLELTAQVGLLATHKTVDAYSESDGSAVAKATSNTRQIKPGIEASYNFNIDDKTLQPFVKADFIYDLKDPVNNDSNAFDFGGGVRIGSEVTGFSGSLEGQTQLGRSDYEEYSVSGMVAYGFDYDLAPRLGIHQRGIASPYIKADFGMDQDKVFGTGLTMNSEDGDTTMELALTRTHARTPDSAVTFKFSQSF